MYADQYPFSDYREATIRVAGGVGPHAYRVADDPGRLARLRSHFWYATLALHIHWR